MFVPFFLHWYASGAVPVAVTANVTGSPSQTVAPDGWPVIEGGISTSRVAAVLVAEPQPFETTTS